MLNRMQLPIFLSIFFTPGLLGEQIQKCSDATEPEQVHISFGDSLSTIVVTWSTTQNAPSVVEYGTGNFRESAEGCTTKFVDDGKLRTVRYVHRVKLQHLEPNKQYVYRCGSKLGWSKEYSFKTVADFSTDWSPSLLFYGDMGVDNAQSLPFLLQDVKENQYDAVLHIGDFAYDMYEQNGTQGDKFMRMIEPIAANLPYMTCPGNHEAAYNFSHYRHRFSMPGHSESLFYSFNMGPAHFIGFDSEPYYFLEEFKLENLLRNQYHWLEKDLKKANSPEERAKRPWIITYAHRPMYCSDNDNDECLHSYNQIRVGIDLDGNERNYGLEDLFMKYGVDLALWAHEHSYERSWPLYNYKVNNGSYDQPYKNPKALVHITSGSAGCREDTDHMIKHPGSWSAFRSSDYGYARLKIHNSTHLHVEQVSVEHVQEKTSFLYSTDASELVRCGWPHLPEVSQTADRHFTTGQYLSLTANRRLPRPAPANTKLNPSSLVLERCWKDVCPVSALDRKRVCQGEAKIIDEIWLSKENHGPYRGHLAEPSVKHAA